jgi:hypothetical protein
MIRKAYLYKLNFKWLINIKILKMFSKITAIMGAFLSAQANAYSNELLINLADEVVPETLTVK